MSTWTARQAAELDRVVVRAKTRILADVEAGTVPADVSDWLSLSDAADAGSYLADEGGGLARTIDRLDVRTRVAFGEEAIRRLDQWLAEGGLRGARPRAAAHAPRSANDTRHGLSDETYIEYGTGFGRHTARWYWGEVVRQSRAQVQSTAQRIDPNGVWNDDLYRQEFDDVQSDEELRDAVRDAFFAEPDGEDVDGWRTLRIRLALRALDRQR